MATAPALNSTIYVNSEELPETQNEYVCWVDIMGTESIMGRSLQVAANFIFRLHVAVLRSRKGSERLYPMLDGMYITNPSQSDMLDLLRGTFGLLAQEFLGASCPEHRFLVKAALAYGPVVHGHGITDKVCRELSSNREVCDYLLLGLPVIAAHSGEKMAPPFGVFVDPSARSFAPSGGKPLPCVWWSWYRPNSPVIPVLRTELDSYFGWCRKNHHALTYGPEKIEEHKSMAIEYFG